MNELRFFVSHEAAEKEKSLKEGDLYAIFNPDMLKSDYPRPIKTIFRK